jgi:hypothetical protein
MKAPVEGCWTTWSENDGGAVRDDDDGDARGKKSA